MNQPGVKEAEKKGIDAKRLVNCITLGGLFRRVCSEQGAPCVIVIDNAHHLFKDQTDVKNTGVGASLALNLQECFRERSVTTIFLNSEDTVSSSFQRCKSTRPIPLCMTRDQNHI